MPPTAAPRAGAPSWSGRTPPTSWPPPGTTPGHLNPLVLADVGQAQYRLDRTTRQVAAGGAGRAPGAERLDRQTFDTWLRRTARTANGRAFFRLVTEAVFSAEPEDVSALWATCYVGSAGGLDALINTTGGAQQDRVVLEAPVTDVEWREGDVRVVTRGAQWSGHAGRYWRCRRRSRRGSASPQGCPVTGTSWSSGCRWGV